MSNLYCSSGGSLAKALPRTMKQLAQSLHRPMTRTSRTNQSAFLHKPLGQGSIQRRKKRQRWFTLKPIEHIFIDRRVRCFRKFSVSRQNPFQLDSSNAKGHLSLTQTVSMTIPLLKMRSACSEPIRRDRL